MEPEFDDEFSESEVEDALSHLNFQGAAPPMPSRMIQQSKGGRRASVSLRLQQEGLQESNRNIAFGSADFAVQSIRRDTEEWHELLRPFVSDLAYRSVIQRHKHSKPAFKIHHGRAAVLFCDLSGYSAVTTKLQSAHLISNIVNAYLHRLLRIVHRFGGDVVKFAGDAFVVVWDSTRDSKTSVTRRPGESMAEEEERLLTMNVICACMCALEMQIKAGTHYIKETNSYFKIHTGVCCGGLESEIFVSSSTLHMPPLFHALSGPTMVEIGVLVDLAKSGETCISPACVERLSEANVQVVLEEPSTTEVVGAMLFEDCKLDPDTEDAMEAHIEHLHMDRLHRRDAPMEEKLIHPSVLRQLSHGGRSPTHIAQMRNLCVLFIGMTSNGSSTNWLMEVQAILDRLSCPIVQIIDDDKGVHLVAAVNLYEAIPEVSVLGL